MHDMLECCRACRELTGVCRCADCDADLEQREVALQWARAKLYLQEMAGNHMKPLVRIMACASSYAHAA